MSSSPVQLAKRALVILLLTLSRQYSLPAVPINRDALDEAINEAFKKVSRKSTQIGAVLSKPRLFFWWLFAWGDTLDSNAAAVRKFLRKRGKVKLRFPTPLPP